MSEPTISILGCSEPLVLEACEVAWMTSLDRRVLAMSSPGDGHWTVTPWTAAVYECALRDAVVTRLRETPDWAVDLIYGDAHYVHADLFAAGGAPFKGEYPTALHFWRAAAQHLKDGPWKETTSDSD